MFYIWLIIFACSWGGYLRADEDPAIATTPPVAVKQQIIENLRGIALIPSDEALLSSDELEQICGVQFYIFLPGSSRSLEKKLSPYLEEPLTTEKIKEIKAAVQNFYVENDNPFVEISVPAQKISSGVLQVVVIPAKLGEITVEGNRWNNEKKIKRYFDLEPGDPINTKHVYQTVSFINRSPLRRADVIYAAGKEKGTTDLIVSMHTKRRIKFYIGADNTGLVRTGRQRLYAGVTIGKILGEDFATYQYTTSYDFKMFQGSTVQYLALLPWQHYFTIYGGYSTIDPNLPFPTTQQKGKSGQCCFRYSIPRNIRPEFTVEGTFGFDYKATNNTAQFSQAFSNFSNVTNLSQFVLESRIGYDWKYTKLELTLEAFGSPGAILPNEEESRYNALRPGATNYWLYGKGALRITQAMPKNFSTTIWLRGQMSTNPLLPSEQFGIGGFSTVRGYDEQQLTMDDAFVGNLEFRSPPIAIINKIRHTNVQDSLVLLAFMDYGIGSNKARIPSESSPQYLWSVGPGVRYTLDPWILFRFDWGWKLHQNNYPGGDSMIHFNATLSY